VTVLSHGVEGVPARKRPLRQARSQRFVELRWFFIGRAGDGGGPLSKSCSAVSGSSSMTASIQYIGRTGASIRVIAAAVILADTRRSSTGPPRVSPTREKRRVRGAAVHRVRRPVPRLNRPSHLTVVAARARPWSSTTSANSADRPARFAASALDHSHRSPPPSAHVGCAVRWRTVRREPPPGPRGRRGFLSERHTYMQWCDPGRSPIKTVVVVRPACDQPSFRFPPDGLDREQVGNGCSPRHSRSHGPPTPGVASVDLRPGGPGSPPGDRPSSPSSGRPRHSFLMHTGQDAATMP
jgi:hypothetical protein